MILVCEYVKWSPKKKRWAYETKPNTLYYESLMLAIAGIVNGFGITLFMTPVKLYDSGISGTILINIKYSFVFDWTQKTRKEIYLLCYIYCFYIFLIRIADCGCFTNRCKYFFTFSRYRFTPLCTIWWYDFRYRKP